MLSANLLVRVNKKYSDNIVKGKKIEKSYKKGKGIFFLHHFIILVNFESKGTKLGTLCNI